MRATLLPHPAHTARGEFSPDGKFVLTTCESATHGSQARLWNSETGRPASDWIVHGGSPVAVPISFSPTGEHFLTSGQDGSVRVHVTENGKQVAAYAMKSVVSDALWSPDGKSLIVAGRNKSLRMLGSTTGDDQFAKLKLPRAPQSYGHTCSMQASPDSRWLAVVAGVNVTLVDLKTWSFGPAFRHRLRVTSVAWRDNERLITASDDYIIREWDATAGLLIREVYRTPRWIWTLQCTRDGRRLLIGTEDVMVGPGHAGHAEVIDMDSGEPVTGWFRHNGTVLAAFSPDESRIATGSSDRTVAVWDPGAGARLHHHDHGSMIYGVRFSPSGDKLLVVGGRKAEILRF